MIIPGRNKALVKMKHLHHTYLYVPEQKPSMSVAEVINARGQFPVGTRVLVPTKAGLPINQNGESMRLINSEDIIALIEKGD